MEQSNKRGGVLLVADPSPAYRLLYSECRRNSMTVIEANNPEEVLEKVLAFGPESIVMDGNFPEMPGEELVWLLRLLRPRMRIVVCTEEPSQDLLAAGADACVAKPLLRASAREALLPYLSEGGDDESPESSD